MKAGEYSEIKMTIEERKHMEKVRKVLRSKTAWKDYPRNIVVYLVDILDEPFFQYQRKSKHQQLEIIKSLIPRSFTISKIVEGKMSYHTKFSERTVLMNTIETMIEDEDKILCFYSRLSLHYDIEYIEHLEDELRTKYDIHLFYFDFLDTDDNIYGYIDYVYRNPWIDKLEPFKGVPRHKAAAVIDTHAMKEFYDTIGEILIIQFSDTYHKMRFFKFTTELEELLMLHKYNDVKYIVISRTTGRSVLKYKVESQISEEIHKVLNLLKEKYP